MASLERMTHPATVGQFLRARRARVSPESVGLPVDVLPRRVPGLRREEVASLAGVSVDYYVRLERGRTRGVSRSVWESLARALRLDEVGKAHLFDLVAAETEQRLRQVALPPQWVSPGLMAVLGTLDQVPAVVLGRRLDWLASNDLFRALYVDFSTRPLLDRNMARFILLDPVAKALYADWAEVAQDVVAILRLYAGSHPGDAELAELVGDLALRSDLCRPEWNKHDVTRHATGSKRFIHPLVGALTLNYETLQPTEDPDLTLVVFHAAPGSPSADALQLLGAWSACDHSPRTPRRTSTA